VTLAPTAAVLALIGMRGWAAWDELVRDYDTGPRLLEWTKPAYPEDARHRGTDGVVVLEVAIDRQGRVETVTVRQSIPGLAEAAMRCVCAWRFAPATRKGKPVRTLSAAAVRFSADGDDAIPGGFVGSGPERVQLDGPWMACPR
jgi:periplasmic protein TonB